MYLIWTLQNIVSTAEGFTSCKLESSCEVHMYFTYTRPSSIPVITAEKYFPAFIVLCISNIVWVCTAVLLWCYHCKCSLPPGWFNTPVHSQPGGASSSSGAFDWSKGRCQPSERGQLLTHKHMNVQCQLPWELNSVVRIMNRSGCR